MLTSGLSLCFAVFLTLMLWLGAAANATTQTLSTLSPGSPPSIASTLFPSEIATARKPLFHFSGQRPDNLGVTSDKLAPCPATPNCVNSQSGSDDQEHFIQPIVLTSSPDRTMAALKEVVQSLDRTEIITDMPNYLYAEFTSALMGFVDDVEFSLDQTAGVIHVRSASRLGESDLGVNRKRVETIRAKFAEQEANSAS
jgi:uncharacterized protein (DUF1499 family)